MKRIVPEYSFTQEQLNTISTLAQVTGLTEHIVRILYARGMDTPEKIRYFMHPSKANFLSPFLMRGMREGVRMIEDAKRDGRCVVVFGDYDADGVSALAILYHALEEFGVTPRIYVPERADGYGLSIECIDRIFEECQPELFITVDCGISCAKEAQYIYELGADVLITDHHELPEVLPDCTIINPKLDDDYPYDNLCGAGVAFKLACALIGEKAYKLLDFAALATVADSVPLLGENRDIVTEGLKLFNESPRSCFSALIGKTHDEITAQTLAFSVAPRINAAGRMGDARSAYELFVSRDEKRIYDLATKLCAYNIERQKCCDELYLSAKEKLRKKGAYGNVIMLSDEKWNSGFVGIVAAKIAEEYNRPTLLFVRNGDMLKGSARSIDSINIFQCLKSCSGHIEEFGGHAQAAGVNIRVEEFDRLEEALDREIGEKYTQEDFQQRVFICEEICEQFDEKFAHELSQMEPYGVGHKRPLFSLTAEKCQVKPIKFNSPHLSVRSEYIDLMYFSGLRYLRIIESDVKKQFVFEINVSNFKGREYIKGFVRDIVYDGRTGDRATDCFVNGIKRLKRESRFSANATPLTTEEILQKIAESGRRCNYGLCMIASSQETLKNYDLPAYGCDLFQPSSRNLSNNIVIAPTYDADLQGYRDFVFLDTPSDFTHSFLSGKKVWYNRDICGYKEFLSLNNDREFLLSIFAALRRQALSLSGRTILEIAEDCDGLGFDVKQFIFALYVFEQLGLIAVENGGVTVYRGVRADLRDSALYRNVCALQEGTLL